MNERTKWLAVGIGVRLRAIRLAAKQTQWQVADAVDVRVPTISGIERGERLPSVELLWDLAGSLGVNVSSLMPAHDPDDVSDGPGPAQGAL